MVSLLSKLKIAVWVAALFFPMVASASLLQSNHFQLDPNVGSNFGGNGSSGSYKLQSTGGEASVGAGASASYKLTQGYLSHLPHSLQLSVIPSGIFAYYPLDTGIGNQIYDVSTSSDQALAIGGGNWVAGQIGQGLRLDGATQYISTSVSQTDPNPYTFELWFKTSSTSGGVLAGFSDVATGAGSVSDRNLYMSNSGQLIFGVHTASYKTVSSSLAYNDGVWHHVAASLGSSGLVLLVDGARVATDGTTTVGTTGTGYWRFGYGVLAGWPSVPTSNFLAADIDELHIFSKQLTDPQANGDYSAGLNKLRFAHVLPLIQPGISTTYDVDAVVQTDAGGYDLNLQAISLLTKTNGALTIPMIGATVSSPAPWVEGTTKGLGFSVISGTGIAAKWGTGPSSYNFAGVPLNASVYHTRTGLSGGLPDKTSLRYRADVSQTQGAGTYSTTVVYTATLKP
jgi:hypothetical protein